MCTLTYIYNTNTALFFQRGDLNAEMLNINELINTIHSQDVLGDDNNKLDHTFKMSFLTDMARGMNFIHNSRLVSNGNLTSSNCLIDKRWTLKVTIFSNGCTLFGHCNGIYMHLSYFPVS